MLAHQIKAFYDRPINIVNVGKFEMPLTMVDNTALMVLPKEDRMDDIKPIKTTGDGNCLFNAASIAICKSETLGIELRLRTALELLTNADFYWSHPIVSSMDLTTLYGNRWPKEGIYDTVIFSNRAVRVHAREGFQRALQHEIYNTLHNRRYSGILQIMGSSSAIGCEVKVVYPDKRHSLLPLLTTTYRPRLGDLQQLPRITIMMTDTSGWTDRSKEFQVNHFVPMLKIDTTSIANKWTRVKRKRHSATRTVEDKAEIKKTRLFSSKSKATLQDFFKSMNSPPSKPNNSMKSPPSKPNDSMNGPPSQPNNSINNPPSKPNDLMNSAPCKPKNFVDSPPSLPNKPTNSSPNTPYTPMSSPPNMPYMPMDSPPSTPYTPMDSPPSMPYTPMDSPPAHTHKMNTNLDLPAVLNPTEDYSSPLPLSAGRPFYRKRGNVYQKNPGTQRKSHEQTKVNQLLECRHSNVAGVLQENVSSLKKKLHFSNPQILPS